MNPDPLLIVLTFDAEADVFDSSIGDKASPLPGFRGIEEGIPLIDGVLRACVDSEGAPARSTWYVRTDRQLGRLFGNEAYLLEKYRHCWQRHAAEGDEIGFHPHLDRISPAESCQEAGGSAIRAQIAGTLAAVRRAGFAPVSSRIGEAFGSNAVMAALDECGFQCDSSAMPGRVRHDAARELDWGPTPAQPFQPSTSDYRTPGSPARSVLEVPMSMVETLADYDRVPLLRYVDLSFHHAAIRKGLSAWLEEARLLVTVTHPSTVLPGISPERHGLLSFDIGVFQRNLQFILAECGRLERRVRFVTMCECANSFRELAKKA